MENTIDVLSQVFESTNVNMVTRFLEDDEYGDKEIVPYFCGRDVCNILKLSDYRKAMHMYVDDDCKISLGELVVDKTSTTSKVNKNLKYNERRSVFSY